MCVRVCEQTYGGGGGGGRWGQGGSGRGGLDLRHCVQMNRLRIKVKISKGHKRPGFIIFKLLNFKDFLLEERSEVFSS